RRLAQFHGLEKPFFTYVSRLEHPAKNHVRLIEEQLGIRFIQEQCLSWEEILEKLEAGEIDLAGSIQNTPERREFLRFTKPYLRVPNVILARKETGKNFTIDRLDGLRIAIVNKSATHTHLAHRPLQWVQALR
ncbi:MAG: transporter substrate-binding domain-containing protein, partial [Verrucomicrobiota bacterium]